MVPIQRPSVNCLAMFVVLLVMNRPVEAQMTTMEPMMDNTMNMNNMNTDNMNMDNMNMDNMNMDNMNMNNMNMDNMSVSMSVMPSPTPRMMMMKSAMMTPMMAKTTSCSTGLVIGDPIKVEVNLKPNSTFKLESLDDFMFKYEMTKECKLDFPTCETGRVPCHCMMKLNNAGYKAVLMLEADMALSGTKVRMVWKGMNSMEMTAMEDVGEIMENCMETVDEDESSSALVVLSSVWLILLGTAVAHSL